MTEGACADPREACWAGTGSSRFPPHPPQANQPSAEGGEGNKKQTRPGLFTIETFPRPFRWERDRVRAISLFVAEVRSRNHFLED
jgi:hypothetical protein